jgi:Cu(I)/Ag(I) efflux system membrane protein CusA/SilA
VIRPLATPVLGGMLSSLAHVLIVTPVIFLWLRERELRRSQSQAETLQPMEAIQLSQNSH